MSDNSIDQSEPRHIPESSLSDTQISGPLMSADAIRKTYEELEEGNLDEEIVFDDDIFEEELEVETDIQDNGQNEDAPPLEG